MSDINQPSLPTPFYSALVSISLFKALSTVFHSINSPTTLPFLTLFLWSQLCLIGPFNYISFHKFSRRLSAFSLCSSGLIFASLVLSTLYLFMKVSLSPDITPQWGAADAEIKVPSDENTELKRSPFKANHTWYAYC